MSRGGSGAAGGEACVRIRDLLNSPVMMELQELRAVGPGAEEDMPDLSSNWFSLQVRVVGTYAFVTSTKFAMHLSVAQAHLGVQALYLL